MTTTSTSHRQLESQANDNEDKLNKKGSVGTRLVRSAIRTVVFAIVLPAGAACLYAYPQQATTPNADNTKTNQSSGVTADQQKNNSSDIELTRQIRRAIMEDKSLSTYAHNVKIITRDGAVTLKGPVESAEEKQAVESKAAAIVGQGNLVSKIRVVAKQSGN